MLGPVVILFARGSVMSAFWIVVLVVTGLALGGLVAWLVASARHARLEEQLRGEREATAEKLAILDDAQKRLSDTFQTLATEALRESKSDFLQLAREKLEGYQNEASKDLDGRKKAIDELVAPIRESLGRVDERYTALAKHIDLLSSETTKLGQALRTTTVRGRWGEIQLRRVVELAGMLDHCDFQEQVTLAGEDGALRPDLVVSLPGGASVVVDAKVPLDAYLSAMEAVDEDTRRSHLEGHSRQVREHMGRLAAKSYWKQFADAPDFVVMFLPGEVFYSAALAHDPTLIEQGFEKRVLLASPTTLISLLRAVHLGWNQERLAENARQISEAGRELYERVVTLAGYFEKLGRSIDSSVKAYNEAVGSLESRVLVSGRRIKELGAGSGVELPEPKAIESSVRALQSPEFAPAPTEPSE